MSKTTVEETKKSRPMDSTLRLAAKLDRLMEELQPWARRWVILFLHAKHCPELKATPDAEPTKDTSRIF